MTQSMVLNSANLVCNSTMIVKDFELRGLDGKRFACCAWLPSDEPRAILQIAHGMGEHKGRYTDVAEALTSQGYAVYASDHRGHGDSIADGKPGAMGKGGWRLTLTDMNYLAEHARREYPARPTILLGHSMGAALSQQYLYLYGSHLAAAILSGSPGFGSAWQLTAMQLFCRLEALRSGPDMPSELLQTMLFGKNNKAFENNDASDENNARSDTGSTSAAAYGTESTSGFEWLSKDALQVKAYLDDPQCGFVLSPASLAQMFAGMRHSAQANNVAAINKNLPLYVLAGADDPVHNEETGLIKLVESYRSAGLAVDYKLYPDGRHEMLNETNRVEVVAHLLDWLDDTVFKPATRT